MTQAKQIILGTAGHIDHGKTALIKAITGTNTDRLKEEQERGITIELGFASMALPSGQNLGVVDVPGHEKFVKNMVAGATGIDIVVMVIAADEGVMPQTREHMEICTLLGIEHGMVALTKVDMVDEEWLELVQEDIKEFVQGTFLEGAPVAAVSAVTGQGIDAFVNTLDQLAAAVPEKPPSDLFRLPIDRVFTMKGFGTVITGTLISGSIEVGRNICIYPEEIVSKVRGLQVHNQSVNEARRGMRTAINFQGMEKASVNRGSIVALPGTLTASYMLDVLFTYLKGNQKPLKNRTRVRFHTGTSEVFGIVVLLEQEELQPGETTVAQLRLDTPLAVIKDDRYVIRSYSPVYTIGGGTILNPIPKKHKSFNEAVNRGLRQLAGGSAEDVIAFHAGEASYQGVSFAHLRLMTNLTSKRLDGVLQGLLSARTLVQIDKDNRIYVHHDVVEGLKAAITGQLSAYHQDNPLKAGMPKEELRSKFTVLQSGRLLNMVMNQLVKEETVVQHENVIRLADHRVSLAADQNDLRQKILDTYQRGGLTPPYFKEVQRHLGSAGADARSVLDLLVADGRIVKVKEELFFDQAAVDKLKQKLVDFLVQNSEITTPQFKDLAGVSRKYLIPLIEYYDAQNVTLRVGDVRKLRKG